ncbi:CGNR zinc finger domain-containing protein [Micromonospora halotolerans]|uniref:CGNR zinc finger domain-containing protein n=1 Tax=Micromonospora halotolerans TaxID=709879 RepID=A0ABY9ZVA1_9ACTN|nr:CGNR zinc finger domain-containing protein [Micromonospora halotolerans]WNM39110.1 CGNR zinc finger domain-containing protein [Micromonospora halotolerans]
MCPYGLFGRVRGRAKRDECGTAAPGARHRPRNCLATLLACPAPRCVRYFVKEHPRQAWCKPSCGNRARVSRHYQRHAANPSDDPSRPTSARSGPTW